MLLLKCSLACRADCFKFVLIFQVHQIEGYFNLNLGMSDVNNRANTFSYVIRKYWEIRILYRFAMKFKQDATTDNLIKTNPLNHP